jgi:hypothetical protein
VAEEMKVNGDVGRHVVIENESGHLGYSK